MMREEDRRHDVRRVVIEDVDLVARPWPRAVGRERTGLSGGGIDINLAMGAASRIVIPKVGETWWIQRRVGHSWHLGWKEDIDAARRGGDLLGIVRDGGTTDNRPELGLSDRGYQYFDTDLNHPVWWNGTTWNDALGSSA
jgi:hypothetical protein